MVMVTSPFPPTGPKPAKLPEPPFDGIIVSVRRIPLKNDHGHEFIQLVVMAGLSPTEETPAKEPLLLFHSFHVIYQNDPRSHLREGDKVRVLEVEPSWNLIVASRLEFDTTQFATRYMENKAAQ
jgi:hypothetical protein